MVRIPGCPVTDCSAIHRMCSKAWEYFTMKLQLPACCLLVLLWSGDGPLPRTRQHPLRTCRGKVQI